MAFEMISENYLTHYIPGLLLFNTYRPNFVQYLDIAALLHAKNSRTIELWESAILIGSTFVDIGKFRGKNMEYFY